MAFQSGIPCYPLKGAAGGTFVPLIRLVKEESFDPEMIKVMSEAFEDALASLHLVDRTDPMTEIVAKKIIECAQAGERDPIRLRDCALKFLAT